MSEMNMDLDHARDALALATDSERRGVDKTVQRLSRMGSEVAACASMAEQTAVAAFLHELLELGHG